jgi:hypothetical protein
MAKKLTRADKTQIATEQLYAHDDSRVIADKREVLIHELEVVNLGITRYTSNLLDAKMQKAILEARITGMNNVLAKR